MATSYERELKGLLVGDEETIRSCSKSLDPQQEKAYRWTVDHPFLVVRGAGSLGVDLVALRGEVAFPIEVKSASDDTVPFSSSSGQYHEQAEEMARECARANVTPIYAFRLKGHLGDAWRVFTLPIPEGALAGKHRVLHRRLPNVARTRQGNFILRWHEGLPLHELYEYLGHVLGP